MATITGFVRTKLVDVLVAASGEPGKDKNAKASNSAQIKDQSSTMSEGQKARFDTTPLLEDGSEGTGNDPRLKDPAFYKEDGTSPIIEWSLLVNGTEVMNTPDNPFQLGSYEDNAGCTPTLKQLRAIGPGRNKCEFGPYVAAENNAGGKRVEGPRAVWYAD